MEEEVIRETTQTSVSVGAASTGALGEPLSYQYTERPPLESIRRLILQPGSGDEPLVGDLEMVGLTDAKDSFEAISYVWGSGKMDETMTINGKSLAITRNLRGALCQVRLRDRPRALWADSICINQRDDVEKGQQVALMGRIYQTSRRTLICLGGKPSDQQYAHDAAALIDEVGAMMDRVFASADLLWQSDSFPYPEADDPLVSERRWDSWVQLVEQPWFGRGWVVQEAALGPDAVLLWAGVEMHWLNILQTELWRLRRAVQSMQNLPHAIIPRSHMQTYAFHRPREAETLLPPSMSERVQALSTLELLQSVRHLKVTNPKDRIYAFMALPTSDGAMPTIQPDYSDKTSHMDVYCEFATRFLDKTSNLDLLNFVDWERSEGADDPLTFPFPSWIPHWDHGFAADVFFPDRPSITRAHDTAPVRSGSLLRVRAVINGPVTYTSREISRYTYPMRPVLMVLALWKEMAPQLLALALAQSPGPPYDLKHVNWTLAFIDALAQSHSLGIFEEYLKSRRAFAEQLLLVQPSNQQPGTPPCPDSVEARIEQDPNAQRVSDFGTGVSHGQRLILFGHGGGGGGCFGIAPRGTVKGDLCAIIYGTRTPFILRKVAGEKDHYKLVGAAYLQSEEAYRNPFGQILGQNEECSDWKKQGLPDEDIFLC